MTSPTDKSLQEILDSALRLCQQQRFAEAEAMYRAAAEQFPNDAPLLGNLGVVLAIQNQLDEAMHWHERAVAAGPDYAPAFYNRGKTLAAMNDFAAAAESFRRAVELAPQNADAISELAICYRRMHRDAEAAGYFEQAIEISPNRQVDHAYLGQIYWDLARQSDSMQHLRRAVELQPNDPQFRLAHGIGLMIEGQFRLGWQEMEFRWRTAEFTDPGFRVPVWDGSPLRGRTVYLHPEQGIGDTIQFIRYAAMVAERGGRVIAGTQTPIKSLIATVPGVALALAAGETLPRIDCWAPLLSLPRIFQTEVDSIPGRAPYMRADEARVKAWRERLGETSGLRVGIVWAGNANHTRDRLRSTTLSTFAPLAAIQNVTFYSLQVGEPADQASSPPPGMKLIDLRPDFADTAALMENLDLVIGVDTSLIHLAGALGRKVWTLLHASPDWRWMLEREDTPWYPTMRLFRQRRYGDWDELMQRVATELGELAT